MNISLFSSTLAWLRRIAWRNSLGQHEDFDRWSAGVSNGDAVNHCFNGTSYERINTTFFGYRITRTLPLHPSSELISFALTQH